MFILTALLINNVDKAQASITIFRRTSAFSAGSLQTEFQVVIRRTMMSCRLAPKTLSFQEQLNKVHTPKLPLRPNAENVIKFTLCSRSIKEFFHRKSFNAGNPLFCFYSLCWTLSIGITLWRWVSICRLCSASPLMSSERWASHDHNLHYDGSDISKLGYGAGHIYENVCFCVFLSGLQRADHPPLGHADALSFLLVWELHPSRDTHHAYSWCFWHSFGGK